LPTAQHKQTVLGAQETMMKQGANDEATNMMKVLTICTTDARIEFCGNGGIVVWGEYGQLSMTVRLNEEQLKCLRAFLRQVNKNSASGIGCEGGEA
jgi:hypothetical protein